MQRTLFASSLACLIAAAACTAQPEEASVSSQITEATTLSGLIADQVRGTDFTAIARSLNPIVSGSGCNRTQATVDTVEHGAVDVVVTPIAAGSATRINVAALVVRGQLQYRLACLTFRAAFTLRADAYVVDGLVVPRVESGALAVSFNGATSRFDGLRVDVAGVPGIIVDQLVAIAAPLLAGALSQAVAAEIPPVVNQFLAGPALAELAGSLEDAVTATDLDAALKAMNPIVNTGGGCTSTRASVSSATHGPGEAVLGQTPSGIATSASVLAVAVLGTVDYRILCLTAHASFAVTADAYRIDGLTTLGVDGASVVATFEGPSSTVENLQVDVAGVPGVIIDVLLPPLRDQLTTVITNQVGQLLPPHVAQFFNDFLSH